MTRELEMEIAGWLARGPARFVLIQPEIQSYQRPFPTDVLTRSPEARGEGLYWSVTVGVRNGKRPYSSQLTARTIAEAWLGALTDLQESVS